MLSDICAELRNYFVRGCQDVHAGEFTVSDGSIEPLSFMQTGQYFRIVGSVFNDGVWQYPATDMTDEVFDGEIWAMRIPKEVVDLSNEIDDWVADNADAINSPYQSESFGGYSYSKGYSGGDSQSATWQSQFASKLARWRKL